MNHHSFAHSVERGFTLTTTWSNPNPNTIWNKLAARLGRQPTNAEARAEVKRILSRNGA